LLHNGHCTSPSCSQSQTSGLQARSGGAGSLGNNGSIAAAMASS
jgi:hypothetical protein